MREPSCLPLQSKTVLRPQSSPVGRFLGLLFFSVFWNGIVSVFVWQVIRAWLNPGGGGWMRWLMPLFLIPFVVVGLLLLGALVYTFLALFNPRVYVTLSSGAVVPGGTVDVEWAVSGRAGMMRLLRLCLEGREETTSQRGTTTHTDKAVFNTITLAETRTAGEMRRGQARLVLPHDTLPSFAAPHNKIVWCVKVDGDIPHWPDVREEFPLTILPPAVHPAS